MRIIFPSGLASVLGSGRVGRKDWASNSSPSPSFSRLSVHDILSPFFLVYTVVKDKNIT